MASPSHFFTVDVEDYFQVSAMEPVVSRDEWEAYPSRVERSTMELVELMEEHGARGTFFILGWVAERQPALVRRIAAGGHEVASHGWDHRRVTTITAPEFRESVRRTRELLEDQSGQAVIGFRAPSFSIVPTREWALDVLLEEGYLYDSSLFPIRRPGYGYPGIPRDPHRIRRAAGTIAEFPPATLELAGVRLPAAGGAYIRILPEQLVTAAVARAERRGQPAMLYIHPWEIDPDQPRLPVGALTRIRHYGGLHRTRGRLTRLLERFRFATVASWLDARRAEPLPPALSLTA